MYGYLLGHKAGIHLEELANLLIVCTYRRIMHALNGITVKYYVLHNKV